MRNRRLLFIYLFFLNDIFVLIYIFFWLDLLYLLYITVIKKNKKKNKVRTKFLF